MFKKIFPDDYKIFFYKSNINNFLRKNKLFYDFGVIDSYKIKLKDETKIKKICKRLITIDDLNNRKFCSDIIINYSPIVKKEDYLKNVKKNTRLFLGSRFNFAWSLVDNKKIQYKKKFNLFFYLGKKNRLKIIDNILDSIKDKKKINKIYIFGNNKKIASHRIFLKKMEKSDILIISSGVTLQEGLSRKKIIFSEHFSKNQKSFYEFYKKKKYIKNILDFKKFINFPIKKINFFLQRQNNKKSLLPKYDKLFNIRRSIIPIDYKNQDSIIIKKYNNEYCKKIYSLQTKENRKYFKNAEIFSFAEHKRYIKNFLSQQNNFLYIAQIKNIFVGYIKLELNNNKFIVSILIKKDFRGQGVATSILKFFKSKKIFGRNLFAHINKKNIGSIKAFRNANFLNTDLNLF